MTVQFEAPTVRGSRETAETPDTLDLAERARLAIQVLTLNPEPGNYYREWQTMRCETNPPYLSSPVWITDKFLESLPMMRVMCGDDAHLDVETDMMRSHVAQIAPDGLVYEPPGASTFMLSEGIWPFSVGQMILAVLAWHQRDGNPAWLEAIDRLNRGGAEPPARPPGVSSPTTSWPGSRVVAW